MSGCRDETRTHTVTTLCRDYPAAGTSASLSARARHDASGNRGQGRASASQAAALGDRGADVQVTQQLGPVRRAGQRRLSHGTVTDEAEIYRAAGFTGPRQIEVPDRVVTRVTDDIVAVVFSLSSSTPYLFGDHAPNSRPSFDSSSQCRPSGMLSEQTRDRHLAAPKHPRKRPMRLSQLTPNLTTTTQTTRSSAIRANLCCTCRTTCPQLSGMVSAKALSDAA
jgi:hypothetical protein